MKQNRFTSKFENKSLSELEAIANDKESFEEEARLAAAWLLEEKAGKTEIQEKREKELKREEEYKASEKKKKYLTNDPSAPELYSKRVITIFSVLFSSLFGAVLLAINFKKVKNNNAFFQVLLFGIAYTALTIFLANVIQIGNIAIMLNWGGALILTEAFWNKHIGKETLHRAKNWIVAAVISVAITAPILYLAIQGY